MSRNLILFGAGPAATFTVEQLVVGDKVIAICDNNQMKIGTRIKGVEVSGIDRIMKKDWDLIVVSSGSMAIYQQLRELNIPNNKILYVKREIMHGDYSRASLSWFFLCISLFFIVVYGIWSTLL